MERFSNQVAVITGASTGIGLAAARGLVREGATVFLFARSAEDLARARAELGERAHIFAGDVRELADLERLYAEVARLAGGIDVLFVNAGVAEFRRAQEADEAHYERVFATNVRGVFYTAQRALPLLRPGAAVVLNTSVANSVGVPGTAIYAASKAAVRSFARTLAAELYPRGVRVNALSPGPTESAIHGKYVEGMDSELLSDMSARTMARLAVGRMAKAEEMASAFLFLASSESAFILGQELVVDGGISAL